MSKDSLIKGTIILTVAAFVARFLGVFQKIPLVHLLGDEGMGSFGIAFTLYSVLLVVATAGIPSALSKMISERMALGRNEEANRIYRTSIWFAIAAGIFMASLMFFLAPWYASDYSEDAKAVLATQMIAPSLLLFPLIAILRGYFQGRQRMMPNGISQVVEQIFRLIFAVGLAYILLGVSDEWAIAGASLGGVAGGIAALGVMVYFATRLRKEDQRSAKSGVMAFTSAESLDNRKAAEHVPVLGNYRAILSSMLKLSIPIVIFSVTVTLVYAIDASSIIPLLQEKFTVNGARELNGILTGRAQSLAGLPIILAIALSQSVVPLISSTYSQGKMELVGHHTSRVMQLAILSGLPMVLIVALGARPLDGFLFGYEKSIYGYENGPIIIAALTVSAMFQIVMQTSGAVLMGLGRMRPLVISVALGIGLKLALNFLLAPWLDIYGIIIATGVCFISMSVVNLLVLRKDIPFTILGKRWGRLCIAVVVLVAIGIGLEQLTHAFVHPFSWYRLNEGLNAIIVCSTILILYPVMLMLMKVLTKDDLDNFPAPVRKLIQKAGKLLRRA